MITEILAEKMLTIPPVILQRGGGKKCKIGGSVNVDLNESQKSEQLSVLFVF